MARAAQVPASNASRGALMLAIPASGKVTVRTARDGKASFVYPNRLGVPTLTADWLDRNTSQLWCPPVSAARKRHFGWVVNQLTDPDDFAQALIWQDEQIAPDVPIFNHPRAVAQTRRDLSATRLADVPGLVVPRCVRFLADSKAAFEKAFSDNAFRFPVLVRPSGTQGGVGQLRLDGPEDWETAVNSPWFGLPHFMVQYEDTRSADGVFYKARIVFVGGQAFVRHVKASTSWQVHNQAPGRVEDDRELEIADRLEASERFRAACAAVPHRTRLDFCGMDVGVDPDRELYVMFECNPSMSVFFPRRPGLSPEQAARRARLQEPAELAMDALLRCPEDWTQPGDLPPVRMALGR